MDWYLAQCEVRRLSEETLRALEARKIDLGFAGLPPPATAAAIQWGSIVQHRTVVVLPAKHSLARSVN